jgi:hypothetical protein
MRMVYSRVHSIFQDIHVGSERERWANVASLFVISLVFVGAIENENLPTPQ